MNKEAFSFLDRITHKTFIPLIFLTLMLLFVGVMFQNRMSELLSEHIAHQTKRQAQTLAAQAAECMESEFKTLGYVANQIEANPEDAERLTALIFAEKGLTQGMLSINGKAIYGEPLSTYAYNGIKKSFRGEASVSYLDGQGLLFTYPVHRGKNIKYALYRLYPPKTLREKFSISCYDDIGKMVIASKDGEIIIPFSQNTASDTEFIESDIIKEYFDSMKREMEVSVAAAHEFQTERGNLILFEAEIPNTDFKLLGFVPKEKASEGVETITRLVVWVFGLLMLLLAVGIISLFRARIQIHESYELKRAKEKAERAQIEAEKASRAKSEFLSNMSHEIRTPINAILGMNEVILRESVNPDILSYSENIAAAGNSLLGLVNDILDISKIEAGKVQIVPVEYDISSLLTDLINTVSIRAENKGLTLYENFNPNLPKRLLGDETRVRQVIANILTNAVKYTKVGSVTLGVDFKPCPEDKNSVVLLVSVRDTGMGIKPEDMDRLFSKFARLDEKQNRNIEGTGLGLAITKNLLELMGAKLEVESVYKKGSTFSFELKQQVIDRTPIGDYKGIQKMSPGRKKYKEKFRAPEAIILAVDDNAVNLTVFKSLLKQTKAKIETAKSGESALRLTESKKYDIIFLDHMMPGMDGIETLQKLKENQNNINIDTPVICLTANAISGAREEYISKGFDDYLTKPVSSNKLEEMIIRYLPREKVHKANFEVLSADIPAEILPLKNILNISAGVENSGGVNDYLELLKLFYESIDSVTAELTKCLEEGDLKNYCIKIHSFKSSARLIGAEELGEFAQKLENAAKEGDSLYIKEHEANFAEYYRSFKLPLSEIFAKTLKDTQKTELKEEDWIKFIDDIKRAAENLDADALEEIFKQTEKYTIPKEYEKTYDKIRECVSSLDYSEILKI